MVRKPLPSLSSAPIVALPRMTASRIHHKPRDSYLDDLRAPAQTVSKASSKSKLLICDLDNTLYAPLSHEGSLGVRPRPYLRTFLEWILHKQTPFNIAVWTLASREWSIAHLRTLDIPELFADDNLSKPLLVPGFLCCWGLQDTGLSEEQVEMHMHPGNKDLDLMWDMLNSRRSNDMPEWSPLNSLIIDDQISNAAAQPDSIIVPPLFTDTSPRTDAWLLQLIGALDHLSRESNFAFSIQEAGWENGFDPKDYDHLEDRGRLACDKLSIDINRGRDTALPERADLLNHVPQMFGNSVKAHDNHKYDAFMNNDGFVPARSLLPCCQDSPHPAVVLGTGPTKIAADSLLFPNENYEKIAAQSSKEMSQPQKPLVCFELDGTLYARPPCHLDPHGDPVARPYLLSFLTWLLRPTSPWKVAFWTSAPRMVAIKALDSLGLGLVGPALVGEYKDQPELLHPRVVALWAREDLGLHKKDFKSYVKVTKDLDMLWEHLEVTGAGSWSAYDTVMVDDGSSKLSGQPDSLIQPPCFFYPLEPSQKTSKSLLDTFLLQLIAMLDELSLESNFASFISKEHWNQDFSKREDEFVRKGLGILNSSKIVAAAEGHGLVPVPPHQRMLVHSIQVWKNYAAEHKAERRKPQRITGALANTTKPFSRAPNTLQRRHFAQDTPPAGVSRPIAKYSAPWHTQQSTLQAATSLTPTSSDEESSPVVITPTSSDDERPLPPRNRPPVPRLSQPSRLRPALTQPDFIARAKSTRRLQVSGTAQSTTLSDSDDDHNISDADHDYSGPERFITEEKELARRQGRNLPKKADPHEALVDAVRDWELTPPDLSVPLVDYDPYQEPNGWRAYRRDFDSPDYQDDD